jgi:membrane protein YdbS with pleckstrin-like domain
MPENSVKQIPAKVKSYTRENWGAPFIVGFMLLLIIAAVSLSVGSVAVADEVAVYAYYALVVGVIGQLVCYLKYRKRTGGSHNEPS